MKKNYYPFKCKCCNLVHEAPEHPLKDKQKDIKQMLKDAGEVLEVPEEKRFGREERMRKKNRAEVYQKLHLAGFI